MLPWLLVTASNHARNARRGRMRYRSFLGRLPHEHAEDPAVVAGERLDGSKRALRLREALRTLSPTDAALLTLTVLDGVPAAEAAAAVGITHDAARTRLSRARRRLRDVLGDLDGTRDDQSTTIGKDAR